MTKISADELRTLFLFESLSDEQLDWVVAHGVVRDYAAGDALCAQGEPAELVFVLLEGEMVLSQRHQGQDLALVRGTKPSVYGGATQFYLGDHIEQTYRHTARAGAHTRVLELPARAFSDAFRDWFPMATHLLEGLFFGMSNARQVIDQRERLTALGTITAGLTHELNNPAAAAARAASDLGERLIAERRRLAQLAAEGVNCERLGALVDQQERFTGSAPLPVRTPLEVSDAEDELGDWLSDHGVGDAWELAPVLVAAGLGVADAEEVAEVTGDGQLSSALHWITDAVEINQLQHEIADATARITNLLGAAKQYSQLDRAPYQTIDVRKLLDSTLIMLKRKIGDKVVVVTDYDPDLPGVPCYPAKLNQVWTNLIDNALDAMGGSGTLTVRTAREGDYALVEIGDTGPGIAEENLTRVFTPFFTTKAVGEGTGLGLDISWRIVAGKHHGDIRIESAPGDTRFKVLLPLTERTNGSDS